jgi:hypothetical protein
MTQKKTNDMTSSEKTDKDPKFARILDIREVCRGKRVFVVGDLHGCMEELVLLNLLTRFDPSKDVMIILGDIIDRGPGIWNLMLMVMTCPGIYMLMGNHEYKLLRYLWSRPVQATSLQKTLESIPKEEFSRVQSWLEKLPHIIRFREDAYAVHAGIDPKFPIDKQLSKVCMMQRTFGGNGFADENAEMWYHAYDRMHARNPDAPTLYFGHIVHDEVTLTTKTVALDTGCVFGGKLSAAVLTPDNEIFVSVPARQAYAERKHYAKS